MVCDCGISMRQWTDSIFMCPRCQIVLRATANGNVTIEKDYGAMAIEMVETYANNIFEKLKDRDKPRKRETTLGMTVNQAVGNFIENTTSTGSPACASNHSGKLTNCEQCSAEMDGYCGAVCPNCKWIRPCSIE